MTELESLKKQIANLQTFIFVELGRHPASYKSIQMAGIQIIDLKPEPK